MHPCCHHLLWIIIGNVKWLPGLFFSSFLLYACVMTLCLLGLKRKWKIIRFPSPRKIFISPAAFISRKMIRIIYAPPDTHFGIWFPVPLGRSAKQSPERPWPLRSVRLWQSWFVNPLFNGQEGEKKMSRDYGLLRRHMWHLPGEWRSSLVSVRMNLHSCLKAKSISDALQKWPLSSRFMPLKTFIPLGWT